MSSQPEPDDSEDGLLDFVTDTDKSELIKYVGEREYLWNPQHPDYKNSITKKLDFDYLTTHILKGVSAKKVWTQLRSQFSRELRKKPRSGSAATVKKTWKFLEEMDFLRVAHKMRKTTSSIDPQSDLACPTQAAEDSQTEASPPAAESGATTDPADPADSHVTSGPAGTTRKTQHAAKVNGSDAAVEPESATSAQGTNASPPAPSGKEGGRGKSGRPRKRKSYDADLQAIADSDQKIISMLSKEPDSLDLFFSSVAASVRALPVAVGAKVKVQVMEVISKAETEASMTQAHTQRDALSPPTSSTSHDVAAQPEAGDFANGFHENPPVSPAFPVAASHCPEPFFVRSETVCRQDRSVSLSADVGNAMRTMSPYMSVRQYYDNGV